MFSGLTPASFIAFMGCLVLSIGIHETMHGLAAHQLGDTTASEEGRLTLNPLKHVDLYMTILIPGAMLLMGIPPIFIAKPVPFDATRVRYGEYGVALLALAGPFSNLLLACLGALLIHSGMFSSLTMVLETFVEINAILFVFNMIPFPPLDGSRLLYAFAPAPLQRAMEQIEGLGIMAFILFFLLLSPVLSPIIINLTANLYNLLLPGLPGV
jgi:Zn-dependent protease